MSYINFRNMSRYNANGNRVLDDDDLRRLAPSIFATEAHESRSARFAYIPTFDVIQGLRNEGFLPVRAQQGHSRVPGKADFTKHMIRFRRTEDVDRPRELSVAIPELILLNAHDGTSRYKLLAGTFRFVCLNGNVVMDEEHGKVAISHTGDVVNRVIEGSYKVIEESRKAVETAEVWNTIRLDGDERQILAEAAHALRFEPGTPVAEAMAPQRLLERRRREDAEQTLWVDNQVIQENLIRGGQHYTARAADNTRRNGTVRPIGSIDGDIKLNAALHVLTTRMAALKGYALAA